MAVLEQHAVDCSPLLRSVIYHLANTPRGERQSYLANLVHMRDQYLAGGGLATLSPSSQIYWLRQAGWLALLVDEPLSAAEGFFAAGRRLLPPELRECHLVVYVANALRYLILLTSRAYREAHALRLASCWQKHSARHWRAVNQLLRYAGGVRQRCRSLLRDPGPALDTVGHQCRLSLRERAFFRGAKDDIALTELAEFIDRGMTGVSLLPPRDPALVDLRRQLAFLPGNKIRGQAPDTKVGVAVKVLSVAAITWTSWLLGSLVSP